MTPRAVRLVLPPIPKPLPPTSLAGLPPLIRDTARRLWASAHACMYQPGFADADAAARYPYDGPLVAHDRVNQALVFNDYNWRRWLFLKLLKRFRQQPPPQSALLELAQRLLDVEDRRNKIVAAHDGLAGAATKRLPHFTLLSASDQRQEARLLLFKAVDFFDAGQASFSTFANWLIGKHLTLRLNKILRETTVPIVFDHDTEPAAPSASAPCGGGSLAAFLKRCGVALTDQQRRAVELRYGFDGSQGHSFAAVAAQMNLSQTRARQLLAAALRKLRGVHAGPIQRV